MATWTLGALAGRIRRGRRRRARLDHLSTPHRRGRHRRASDDRQGSHGREERLRRLRRRLFAQRARAGPRQHRHHHRRQARACPTAAHRPQLPDRSRRRRRPTSRPSTSAERPAPSRTAARSGELDRVRGGAEATPYAKVGGLGDVAAALPKALARLGHRGAASCCPAPAGCSPTCAASRGRRSCRSATASRPCGRSRASCRAATRPVVVHLLDAPRRSLQNEVYGGDDEGDRFALFANAVLYDAIAEATSTPDVVHVHDWHTALAPDPPARAATPATCASPRCAPC